MFVRQFFLYIRWEQLLYTLVGFLLYMPFPLLVLYGEHNLLSEKFFLTYLLIPIFFYISFVDFKTYIIPDWCNFFVLLLGGVNIFLFAEHPLWFHISGAALALVLSFSVRQTFLILSQKEALGFGDVKLFTVCGLWVGFSGVPSVIFLSSMIAIIFLLSSSVSRVGKLENSHELPFGPFICLGTWIVWWLGPIGFSL